jgi:predicted DNA-binding protein with PD1-like motif
MEINMKVVKGKISDILVIRLKNGESMINGIKQACMENSVKNAVIIGMTGSLEGACYCVPVKDLSKQCGISDSGPILLDGPLELLSGQGEIRHKDDGKLSVHLHGTFADEKGNVYGGHIEGEENKVLFTLNIVIGVIEGVDMGLEWEAALGFSNLQLCPKEI